MFMETITLVINQSIVGKKDNRQTYMLLYERKIASINPQV